jgi:hypothetical protein
VAQVAADKHGDIGPFQYAIALTVIALVIIVWLWGENYGDKHTPAPQPEQPANGSNGHSKVEPTSDQGEHSLKHTMIETFKVIRKDPKILLLGLSQATYEGAVYSFGKACKRMRLLHI